MVPDGRTDRRTEWTDGRTDGRTQPKLYPSDFVGVNEIDPIKNEGARVVTTLTINF